MKDEFGRINNRHQAIGEFSLIDLAYLLNMISRYPTEYPNNYEGWKDWLRQASGEDIENF